MGTSIYPLALADKERKYVSAYTFEELTECRLTLFSETVSIKVVLPKSFKCDKKPSFKLISAENAFLTDEGILDVYDPLWEAYKCYEGTDIGVHDLTTARYRGKRGGSCSLIGSGNYVLTNRHVLWRESNLEDAEILFNYFNESCDLNSMSVEPVRIKGGRIIKTGGYDDHPGIGIDYTLFSLDEFDYRNAEVKKLFGGLKITENKVNRGDIVYEPHYARSHPMLLSIKDEYGNDFNVVVQVTPDLTVTTCPVA